MLREREFSEENTRLGKSWIHSQGRVVRMFLIPNVLFSQEILRYNLVI
jgi:hypothetical protein